MALRRDRRAWNEKRRKRYAEDEEYRERRKAEGRAYHAAHREKNNERQRRRSWAKKLSDFWRRLARFYGISREQYEALLAKQGGVCGICRKPPQEPLCVDHSHATGRVRGLLCRKCNTALGSFDDDVSVMAAGIAYIRTAAADEAAIVAATAGAATPKWSRCPDGDTLLGVAAHTCGDGEHSRKGRPDNPFDARRCVKCN
jgi:hypothetical protein